MGRRWRVDRRFLFFCLYLSEGAPIGYIWLALPTRLRGEGVSVRDITTLTALVILPWTFKFAWAPLLDLLQRPRWGVRQWIFSAQSLMGLTLLATQWISPTAEFSLLVAVLFAHAVAAATQDVGIDALCIASTAAEERGRLNGWMQAGMLLGRSLMGGGALVLGRVIGHARVVWLLVLMTTFSMALLAATDLRGPVRAASSRERLRTMGGDLRAALADRSTWLGLTLAAVGGAGFKSLEVLLGPFLIDRGYTETEVGWFTAIPMITAMGLGSLAGGVLADRGPRTTFVAVALGTLNAVIFGLAVSDLALGQSRGPHLLGLLALTAIGIGVFTASSYALFMDLTRPAIAATQFSAFMGATNACEAWSTYVAGRVVESAGYPVAMIAMVAASTLALPVLPRLRRARETRESSDAETGSGRPW